MAKRAIIIFIFLSVFLLTGFFNTVHAEEGQILTDQSQLINDGYDYVGTPDRQWFIQSWIAEEDNFVGIQLYGARINSNWNSPYVVLCHGEPVFNGIGDTPLAHTAMLCGEEAEFVNLIFANSSDMPYGYWDWFSWQTTGNYCIDVENNDATVPCPESIPLVKGDKYFVKINFGGFMYYRGMMFRNSEGGYDNGVGYYMNNYHNQLTEIGDWQFATLYQKPDQLDPVILVPGFLGSWNVPLFGWQLDPILNTYDNLWEALKLAGYEEGVNLFAFPYNFRLSNSYTAELLKDKIDEVKDVCDCDRVDLITHSMGGLVARAYVELGDYENDIDQLIFLGTPHKGASKSYLTWEAGEVGPGRDDFLYERIFKVEAEFNGYPSVFRYIRELPMLSVQELLPIYDYLRDKDTMELRQYSNNYPQNLFLELLNNPINLDKLSDININNIIANAGEQSTINNFRVIDENFSDNEWEHGYPEGYNSLFGDHGIEYGNGDGSVSFRSNDNFLNLDNTEIDSAHTSMITDAQKIIIKELTGIEPDEEVRNNIFINYLLVRIFSPADFIVIAPNGNRVGKDFSGSGIINEIEDAFYSGFDNGPEFVTIPNPVEGDYQVHLQGTGQGAYRLSVSYIDEENEVDQDYTGNISLDDNQEIDFSFFEDELISELIPNIESVEGLVEVIEGLYERGLIYHFGNKNVLISRLENQSLNSRKINQLINFVNNMLAKERLNQYAYDIIINSLNNIKNNL